MRLASLLAAFAFAAGLGAPALADTSPAPAALATQAAASEACLARAKGDRLAQIDCCKAHKGVCGCRAGKIVCCDSTTSTEPGCACHGDEGSIE